MLNHINDDISGGGDGSGYGDNNSTRGIEHSVQFSSSQSLN